MYSDTMFAKKKSIRKFTCAQNWTDGQGYTLFYPMKSKSEAPNTISRMCHDMKAIPEVIVTDGAGEERGLAFRAEVLKIRSKQHWTEPYSSWQNRAERDIQELKKAIKRVTIRCRSPRRLWCYCGEWAAAVRRLTAHDIPALNGFTAEERIHARTPDISAYAMFDWYQPVWYIDPVENGVDPRRKLGRWIGVAEHFGAPMCYFVLPKSGRPIARSSVFHVTKEDMLSLATQTALAEFDAEINRLIGDKVGDADAAIGADDPLRLAGIPDDVFDVDDDDPTSEPADGEERMPEADEEYSPEAFDKYLTACVLLDRGGEAQLGVVKKRRKGVDGNPIGRSNNNPLLDTREYEVEFPDGSVDVLTANTIAEALYSQVDDEGRTYAVLSGIVDHRKDGSAVALDDSFMPGTRNRIRTTKGWQLLVEWKDGTSDWLPLADLKESYPIDVAEYAVNNKIASEPAFAWWVPQVLKKRDRIIKTVKTRYFRRTHKFGIELPKTVEEAFAIDERAGTDLWRLAIEKEMRNVQVALDVREDGVVPVGYKEITCHLVFDIKLDTLQRKARFVAGGHRTDPPKDSTYSSVVSRDSVRLFFLLAALNDVDVLACDIQNAYINAETKEKVWFRAGAELGANNKGKVVVIVRALYGLKSSGARFREHLAQTLRDAGFVSSKADPDVWLRAAVKPDGTKIYEYVLCYVDDCIFQGLDPNAFMDHLRKSYTLKEGSVKEPETYLGADILWHEVSGNNLAWALSQDTYVRRAVVEVERYLGERGRQLKKTGVVSPLSSGYRPELDASPELDDEQASYYSSLMGVLRWILELGRIDIMVETGLLAWF